MTKAEMIDEIIENLKWISERMKPDMISGIPPERSISDSVLDLAPSISENAHTSSAL